MPDTPSEASLSPVAGVRIGVFDSGVGGLSVLRALREQLPDAELLYVADSGHAPYGEKTDAFVVARSQAIADFLMAQGADMLVVACNTATAAAVQALRSTWPDVPIVGVEPGIKPAATLSRNGKVGVLATEGTLASQRFRDLLARHGHSVSVVTQACPGLAREIELGELDSPQLRTLVATFSQPLLRAGVDTVVLGCTHYPFVRELFQAVLGPAVTIVDTSDAVARRAATLAATVRPRPRATVTPGAARLWSSGDPARLSSVAARWLGLIAPAHALP